MRKRLMFAFAVVSLCIGILGVVAHYYAPGSLYTLTLAAFSPYLGLGSVVALALFVFVRTPAGWIAAALSAAVAVWVIALHVPNYIATTAPAHGTNVVVMTSNLKIGGADPAAVVAAVRTHHVDVLMLEELTPEIRSALRTAGLDAALPHSVSDPQQGASGTGLWSRYPLTQTQASERLGFAYVTARVEVSGQPISVAAVHIFGPYPQPQFPGWQSNMARYPAVLGDLTGPTVLVGGDFNSTPDTAQFRTILNHGFSDAANQAGAGFTPTWPADRWFPPLITIDHVLTRGAVATAVDSIEIPGSDHRALVASIRIPNA